MILMLLVSWLAFTPAGKDAAMGLRNSEEARLAMRVFERSGLNKMGLSMHAWVTAFSGYLKLKAEGLLQNARYLSIADFSKDGGARRFFVVDLQDTCVVYHTLVSHGRNSGARFATQFSNTENSLMSSLGFFITGSTYMGQHGLSLRLFGQERGFNDQAERRGIVVHGADYVSEKVVSEQGYVGRSWGCPALPEALTAPVINTIRDGSAFFIYHPSERYRQASKFLKNQPAYN
jgi:hypothetical protein